MKRLSSVALLGCVGLLSCMPTLPGYDYKLAGQEVRLTLLHTSDIHSRLLPYDFAPAKTDVDLGIIPEAGPFGGATRMAALLERERARGERVLHLDSGDCFQGAPIFNLNSGEVEFRFLSGVGLDAAVIGNHEFDAGALNFVTQARDHARFPLLAANYAWDDARQIDNNQASQYTAPYTIKNVSGLRVGVIGMANLSSLNSIVEGGNSMQVTPLEQNEVLRGYVDLLRPMVDLVVVVSHLGLTEDQDLIRGYHAYYEYGRIKSFLQYPHEGSTYQCDLTEPGGADSPACRNKPQAKWDIEEWYGQKLDDEAVVRVRIAGVSGVDVILGGHLHIVLNPPQTLVDPSGRKVVLSHSGAFAKYVGRMDLVVKVPEADAPSLDGAEVVSHDYRVFPLDAVWCDDAIRAFYFQNFWEAGQWRRSPQVMDAVARCELLEDRRTTQLLQPYILGMDLNLSLSSIFAYAPTDIARRNNSSGGDSPLGNLAADSMRKRQRVDAEMAVTNTLGIRDNLYTGPIAQESMFNVFPFENTINIMYLSGTEVQDMLDFVAARSASRGCVAQAQVSGVRFTMDCAQEQLNDLRMRCDVTRPRTEVPPECPSEDREGRAPWTCIEDEVEGDAWGRCWAHPATGIQVAGNPLDPNGTYKVAVNDYIAKGGSGFTMLKRNTTRVETGISLRDSLIGYMRGFCTCDDINAGYVTRGNRPDGEPCGELVSPGVSEERRVDDTTRAYCQAAGAFKTLLAQAVGGCTCADVLSGNAAACGGAITDEMKAQCGTSAGPNLGSCSCADALRGDVLCGHVTRETRAFCLNPTSVAVISAVEDGRIGRRVQ